MTPELITAFTAGVASTAVTGGLAAAWTVHRLVKAHKRQAETEATEPERDESTGLYTKGGFVTAVEDLAVTDAATNPTRNRLILLECSGLDEIEDTYGSEAFHYARRSMIDALKLLAGPEGLVAHAEGERRFILLATERACQFVEAGKLWASVIDVATPEPDDDPCPELRQFGRDYLGARHCFDPQMGGVEIFDEVRCEVKATACTYEPGADVRGLLSVLDSGLWQAWRRDQRFARINVAIDELAKAG